MIEETLKIFVTEKFDTKDFTFDFDKTPDNEKTLYNWIIERGFNQIIHFAGPNGYFAELLWNTEVAILVIPESLYNDTGFQELLFNLSEFGLSCIETRDFGYNISFYNCK